MFVGYFTERPYQDPGSGYFGATGKPIMDLTVSNENYDAKLGAELYNRYLDEKMYAEEMDFDGLMLNEHHGTPFCMGGAMNVEASILGPHDQPGQDCPAGQYTAHLGRPAVAGGAALHDRHDFPGPPGVRVGTGDGSGERGPQFAASLQLGTVPGGPRVRR